MAGENDTSQLRESELLAMPAAESRTTKHSPTDASTPPGTHAPDNSHNSSATSPRRDQRHPSHPISRSEQGNDNIDEEEEEENEHRLIIVAEDDIPTGILQRQIDAMVQDARKANAPIGPVEDDPFFEDGDEEGSWDLPDRKGGSDGGSEQAEDEEEEDEEEEEEEVVVKFGAAPGQPQVGWLERQCLLERDPRKKGESRRKRG